MRVSRQEILPSLALVAIYVVVAKLTLLLFGGHKVISYLWLVTGVALTFALFQGARIYFAVLAGSLLGFLVVGQAFGAALDGALRHTLVLAISLWLLKRAGGLDPDLKSLGAYFRILVLATLVGVLTAGVTWIQQLLDLPYPGAFSLPQRFSGTAMGIIIVMPLALVWRHLPREWGKGRLPLDAALILGLAFLMGQVVFLDWFKDSVGQVARGYWMFLLVT